VPTQQVVDASGNTRLYLYSIPDPQAQAEEHAAFRAHVARDANGGRDNYYPVTGPLTDVNSPARVALRLEMQAELRRVKEGEGQSG
jgi:hypothetical protein